MKHLLKLGDLSSEQIISILDLADKLKDENGNLKKEYTYDGLHINAQAYEIVAENVIPLLK